MITRASFLFTILVATSVTVVDSFAPSQAPARNQQLHRPFPLSKRTGVLVARGPSSTRKSQQELRETKDSNDLDISALVNEAAEIASTAGGDDTANVKSDAATDDIDEEQLAKDEMYMRQALQMAQSSGGERGARASYPKPMVGAVLVSTKTGRVLGKGRSDYETDALFACLQDAGLEITPLQDWCVTWPAQQSLRQDLKDSTLYITLEPSAERQGTAVPAMTQLILSVGIPRVVIACPHPAPELSTKGAAALHQAGTSVSLGMVLREECANIISGYTNLVNSKLHRMARKHLQQYGRPLGFLHCSVVDSDNIEAFARHGNAFGTNFGGHKDLNFRDFGSYEIAPPPEVIWASDEEEEEDFDTEVDSFFESVEFDEEDYQGDIGMNNPMMPWYEQVDAVAVTFPRPGNGPVDDDSVTARLNGLKWLATYGQKLPAGVERILVMDATDLADLPLTNDNPHWPKEFVDVEAFWKAENRKPTRVLLRRGVHVQARAAAKAAAVAAQAAADAAEAAIAATESGDAEIAAEAALSFQRTAQQQTAMIQEELQRAQKLKQNLENAGVVVETIEGGDPIHVMKHLGKRNGCRSVFWRAGCWGNRGVQAILQGAFQWVSAHLAVDAVGGKFWQLMLAENAVQAACGPERKVRVFADQDDISLEYCDEPDVDKDCALTIDGRPVRHIRLDCRVALVDDERSRELSILPTQKVDRKIIEEEAPWFL